MDIQTIHDSLLNGQRTQMTKQIDEYGIYDFFSDYKTFLEGLYTITTMYEYFTDVTVSYHRIKNR